MYIYMYVPKDDLVEADSRFEGSRNDHYYHSKGATMDNAQLKPYRRVFGCSTCMKLLSGYRLKSANSERSIGNIREKNLYQSSRSDHMMRLLILTGQGSCSNISLRVFCQA